MIETQVAPALSAKQLINEFSRNVWVIERQTAGLNHADSLLQPQVRGNCLNWVLGHIAVHRDYVLQVLGEERLFGEARSVRYDGGSAPILEDGEGVLPLEDLIAVIKQGQERIAARLEQISDGEMAQQSPLSESMTVGANVLFLNWHETYHVGQTEFLRQLAGTNDSVI